MKVLSKYSLQLLQRCQFAILSIWTFNKGTALFVLLVLGTYSCGDIGSKVIQNQNSGAAFGTSYTLIYESEAKLDYGNEIDSVIQAVNKSMSTYSSHSDISRINNGDTTVVVDHMFKDVFTLSKKVYERTNGYFDPTVGVLVNAWGFGPEKKIALDSLGVDSLMNFVGFDKVALTMDNKIRKKIKTLRFDFNAIAKGYAIDRLAVLMNQKGVTNYLLEVGGEVVAKGMNTKKKKPWAIGINDPEILDQRAYKIVIGLFDKALASSGNYRKFRIDSITKKRYVHTIDPKTGYSKNGKTLAANVLAKTCAEADAYATAFMAMNLDLALEILKAQNDIDAYLIYLDDAGEVQEFMTDGFKLTVIQ